jgi:hypothetical protein
MIPWKLILLSALVMLILEYFVLLNLYKRSPSLQKISLIVAPLMIALAVIITYWIQPQQIYINPLILFLVLVLLELPLSLYGYELYPPASVVERLIVAGTFGTAAVLISQSILLYVA